VLLARAGAEVFVIDVNDTAVAETRQLIEAKGNSCVTRRCDMLVPEEVEAAIAACLDGFGRIDILVNNVGGSTPGGPATSHQNRRRSQPPPGSTRQPAKPSAKPKCQLRMDQSR
jgi:NAD(P)-dependent dehydrogenase (short-subunit alcohol dehydrogenase family)